MTRCFLAWTPLACSGPGGGTLTAANHRFLLGFIGRLESRPPLRQSGIGLAGLGAQDKKIVSRTEPGVAQQTERPATLGHFKARLHGPDFSNRQADTFWQSNQPDLTIDDFIARILIRQEGVLPSVDQLLGAGTNRLPQQCSKQEVRRHRLVFSDPTIRSLQ